MNRWQKLIRIGIFVCAVWVLMLDVSFTQVKGGVLIDDFSQYQIDKLATGVDDQWRIFSLTNFYQDYYYVQEERGNKFLRAVVPQHLERKKKAITLIKRIFKNHDQEGNKTFYLSQDYPLLSWKWRVHKLPSGSDERIEDEQIQKSDSAAGVYVYFQKEGQNPFIIKYIWSETLPVGSPTFVSPASKDVYKAHLVVLRSSEKDLGRWLEEKVNIYEDFKNKFGQDKEPPRILGIGVLTDADSTDTEAAADYDDFYLMKP